MKHIKMLLYGEPGIGKSVFACKFPKPFFITTDGNYEWLEDFGAKEEDHVQVDSWDAAKKAFSMDFKEYDTIVVDLLEDLFKWCEYEFCEKNKLDHISDLGYGKGYDITRNEFFIELCKLIGKEKNVVLLSHEITVTTKDRRGVDHTSIRPSSRIPDKVLDMIEGRMRFINRCYYKLETQEDGTIIQTRMLSLVPKENEYGVIRGVNTDSYPQDIPLDAKVFLDTVKLFDDKGIVTPSNVVEKKVVKTSTPANVEIKKEDSVKEKAVVDENKEDLVKDAIIKKLKNKISITSTESTETTPVNEAPKEVTKEVTKEEAIPTVKLDNKEEAKEVDTSNDDRIAAIKAKLAALKNASK